MILMRRRKVMMGFVSLTVPTVSFTSVTARLHQSATLPCTYGCSGLVRWTVFPNPHYIVVRCDQRACWSEKGYEMSHDQYLKGNLSLTITAVDYSKRAFYTCDCDGAEACEVHLIIDRKLSYVPSVSFIQVCCFCYLIGLGFFFFLQF